MGFQQTLVRAPSEDSVRRKVFLGQATMVECHGGPCGSVGGGGISQVTSPLLCNIDVEMSGIAGG